MYSYTFYAHNISRSFESVSASIGGVPLTLEFAKTPEEHTRGLMGRYSMPASHGMLFLFDSPAEQNFWNKDTHIPLDVIWLKGKKVIGVSALPAVEERGLIIVSSHEPVDGVLEMNKNFFSEHDIHLGDELTY